MPPALYFLPRSHSAGRNRRKAREAGAGRAGREGQEGRIVGAARLTNTRDQAAGCMETGPTGFPNKTQGPQGVCVSVIRCVCVLWVCDLVKTNNDEFGR